MFRWKSLLQGVFHGMGSRKKLYGILSPHKFRAFSLEYFLEFYKLLTSFNIILMSSSTVNLKKRVDSSNVVISTVWEPTVTQRYCEKAWDLLLKRLQ